MPVSRNGNLLSFLPADLLDKGLGQSDTERITPFRDFLVDHGYSPKKRQVYTLNIQQEMEKFLNTNSAIFLEFDKSNV